MRRMQLKELHDHPRFPSGLRDLVTDALEALWAFGNSYKPILGRLHAGLTASGKIRVAVVDLCSGGGGPWLGIARQLEQQYGCPVDVSLTDKFPNSDAIHLLKNRLRESGSRRSRITEASSEVKDEGGSIDFVGTPVDAMRVPEHLQGYRTMFSSFHHFDPAEAQEILTSAMVSGQGIGVFEVAERGLKTMAVLCLTPILVLLLTPVIRPFRWSRLLWTYIVPVVPFVIWFDGWMSCLRAYSEVELREMLSAVERHPLANRYKWEVGKATTGLLPVTYILGHQVTGATRSVERIDRVA